jgi:hypothetical protein
MGPLRWGVGYGTTYYAQRAYAYPIKYKQIQRVTPIPKISKIPPQDSKIFPMKILNPGFFLSYPGSALLLGSGFELVFLSTDRTCRGYDSRAYLILVYYPPLSAFTDVPGLAVIGLVESEPFDVGHDFFRVDHSKPRNSSLSVASAGIF